MAAGNESNKLKSPSLTVPVLVLIVCIAIGVWLTTSKENKPGFKSAHASFRAAAVVSDEQVCSEIGRDIMEIRNGSVVDAAVATVLCVGVASAQACGIGGGHFMLIYDKMGGQEKEAFSINAREKAPLKASQNMFPDPNIHNGSQSIAVPGTIRGLHEAWLRFGRLPWKDVLQPVVDLCDKGFPVNPILAGHIKTEVLKYSEDFPELAEAMLKPDGSPYEAGDLMRRPVLGATLQRLADDGAESFYTGSLAKDVLADLQDAGSIITQRDLETYSTAFDKIQGVSVAKGTMDLFTTPLPTGGPLMQYMFRILEGFQYLQSQHPDVALTDNVFFHQAMVEVYKFGFAIRSLLGDDEFHDMTEVMKNLTSEDYIRQIQSKIDLCHTHPEDYYGAHYMNREDHGTSHMALVAPDGSAVSVTASINYYFGSLVYGRRTGIIFNNEMDDFSRLGTSNDWEIHPSPFNLIEPEKRPLSSMYPTIVVDRKSGMPRLVIGGAGGSQISTMVTLVSYLNLELGLDLNDAVDFPRVHSQLYPNKVYLERNVDKNVVAGLAARGHNTTGPREEFIAVVCGIEGHCDPSETGHDHGSCTYTAVGDGRRDAAVSGFD